MSHFPPPQAPQPQVPQHTETIQERFKRWPIWGRVLAVLAVLAVVVPVIGLVGKNKPDAESSPSASDQRLESLRVTWNGLSAQQQSDICASVNKQGVDVAADAVQEAAGDYGAEAHDDVVFFLEDLACD